MRMGGVGKLRKLREGKFEHDISHRSSAAISKITEETIEVDVSKPIPSELSMLIPPLVRVTAISNSQGTSNPKVFISVDSYYRHLTCNNTYAVGVAVVIPPTDETALPARVSGTGHMTELMATIAAQDMVAKMEGREAKPTSSSPFAHKMSEIRAFNWGLTQFVHPGTNYPPSLRTTLAVDKHIFEQTYLSRAKQRQHGPTTFGW